MGILDKNEHYLEGQLLVATPIISESCFARSVIYMCAHNPNGAMGVIINTTVDGIRFGDLLSHLGITPGFPISAPVHFGGPVDPNRGFILHSGESEAGVDIIRHGAIGLSSDITLLKAIAEGKGPAQSILALGYAAWGPGQLEQEIATGSWLTLPASQKLVFETDNDAKWLLAGQSNGIDLSRLSLTVGHA